MENLTSKTDLIGNSEEKIMELKEKWIKMCDIIQDSSVKQVVLDTLPHIPDYFWTIPSSSSGKYHPKDEIFDGGLVIHTLRTCIVCNEMAAMNNLSQFDKDICIAALLLHDCCKSGLNNSGRTVHEHPALAADLVRSCNKSNDEVVNNIANLIDTHMGRWTTSAYSEIILNEPKSELQKFVHMCDMFASRPAWHIYIEGEK